MLDVASRAGISQQHSWVFLSTGVETRTASGHNARFGLNRPSGMRRSTSFTTMKAFDGYRLGEYEGITTAHDIACFIAEFGGELLGRVSSVEEARKTTEEDYCGSYESLADYAQELTEETTQIPESLAYYINYEAMARDMELNGDVFSLETGYREVHEFWNR